VDEANGEHSTTLEIVTLTSDVSGNIQDYKGNRYSLTVKDEDLPFVKKNGISFDTSLAVKKPDAYYVRAAVKDAASGKMGSAYQFLDVPDLKKNRLTLSSIFVLNQKEDESRIDAGNLTASEKEKKSANELRAVRKSPALRSYLPGEGLDYLAIAYNAKNKDSIPELESQISIFQEGNELFKNSVEGIDLKGVEDLGRIPIKRRLTFDKTMKPGEYMLQLSVVDKNAKEKNRLATQMLEFEILPTSEEATDSK
jgi:hypothetical protein